MLGAKISLWKRTDSVQTNKKLIVLVVVVAAAVQVDWLIKPIDEGELSWQSLQDDVEAGPPPVRSKWGRHWHAFNLPFYFGLCSF